jgi:hypothetical protein
MPVSQPTRNAAFSLRRTEYGCEEVFCFQSQKDLVVDLARRCSFRLPTGISPPKIFSADGTFLHLLVESTVQTAHSKWGSVWSLHCETSIGLEAFSPSGRPLNLRGLLELAQSLHPKKYISRRGGFYCGYGPVPGIHKNRGGRWGYFRNIQTTTEHRLNNLVVFEDGEVPARSARAGHNLPDSWDDIAHGRKSVGWKAQRKGRKSWMR